MLLLFETPAGFSLFKVKNEGKLDDAEVRRPLFLRRILPATAGACVTFLTSTVGVARATPRGARAPGARRREITAISVARMCAIAARSFARPPRTPTRENPRAS